MSPGDIGQLVKPFIFLDYVDAPGGAGPNFGFHPHSGIATLTFPLTFDMQHESSAGRIDVVPQGGVEWVVAGGGIWHRAKPLNSERPDGGRLQAFQLWLALSPSHEQGQAQTLFVQPESVPVCGPVTVLLGSYAGAHSPIFAPLDANYFFVRLRDGETWSFEPPATQDVAWTFARTGALEVSGETLVSELAAFEEGHGAMHFRARGDSSFLVGTAAKHPHHLVLGPYSVHTSHTALESSARRISEIRGKLQSEGRL